MFMKPLTITEDQADLLLYLQAPPEDALKNIGKLVGQQNWSLSQIFPGLPRTIFESLYEIAKRYYEAGDYKSALPLFYALMCYDHHCYKYMLGTAACIHLLGDLALASRLYAAAYAADPSNPVPLFYAAECVEKLGSKKEAILLLDLAVALSGNRKECSVLKQQAGLIKARLQKQS